MKFWRFINMSLQTFWKWVKQLRLTNHMMNMGFLEPLHLNLHFFCKFSYFLNSRLETQYCLAFLCRRPISPFQLNFFEFCKWKFHLRQNSCQHLCPWSCVFRLIILIKLFVVFIILLKEIDNIFWVRKGVMRDKLD